MLLWKAFLLKLPFLSVWRKYNFGIECRTFRSGCFIILKLFYYFLSAFRFMVVQKIYISYEICFCRICITTTAIFHHWKKYEMHITTCNFWKDNFQPIDTESFLLLFSEISQLTNYFCDFKFWRNFPRASVKFKIWNFVFFDLLAVAKFMITYIGHI